MGTTNPIQRKSRNSFLLGILVAVLIMGLVVAFLLWQLMNMKDAENKRLAKAQDLYVLTASVKSGDTVSLDKLSKMSVDGDVAPSNAIKISDITSDTIAKIDLEKGTVLTTAMIVESNEATTDDLRVQEYNMINVSSQLTSDDYIDIRMRMPSGLDYVIVSKKRIQVPLIDGVDSVNTIWVKLTEAETLLMSNAIVETYMNDGAILYTSKYVEPGMQKVATSTYVPSANVQNLIYKNPNIEQEAKNALINRFNANTETRDQINSAVQPNSEESVEAVKEKTRQEYQDAQAQRQAYLDSLAGV